MGSSVHNTHKTSVLGFFVFFVCAFSTFHFKNDLSKMPPARIKKRTQKTQKYLALIFVIFVYVFWTFGSKNDLSEMLPEVSKRVRKKRKNQGEVFLRFLRTQFPPLI